MIARYINRISELEVKLSKLILDRNCLKFKYFKNIKFKVPFNEESLKAKIDISNRKIEETELDLMKHKTLYSVLDCPFENSYALDEINSDKDFKDYSDVTIETMKVWSEEFDKELEDTIKDAIEKVK